MRSLPIFFILVLTCFTLNGAVDAQGLAEPRVDTAFWNHWGDGHAELAGYELVYPRYGNARRGTAATIFVTETFSNRLRVKADPGNHPPEDEFPVMKLNLIQGFQTGVYNYNLMTSTFVSLARINDRPVGTTTKVSFSSQEWCGQVWHQAAFDKDRVRHTFHSYFDRQADESAELPHPVGGISEDALFHWARGLASPVIEPGQSVTVPILRSLSFARLSHKPLGWQQVTLASSPGTKTVNCPAGAIECRTLTARIDNGPTWSFEVEVPHPHRIVRWTTSDGQEAFLVGSARMKYWEMNGPGFEAALKELGLTPRGERMP